MNPYWRICNNVTVVVLSINFATHYDAYIIEGYPRGLVMTENEGGAIDLTTIIVVVAILALILWASQSPQVGLDQITNLLGEG